ncbi:MAG: site-specific DNA-methyltransferase [Ignavibacteriae bacterium]|nr:site-specific DNA-methyltransferase [Ignavibacteriota bacterium]
MNGESLHIIENQLEKLKQLFPEVFTEGKVDWEKLQTTVGKNNIEFHNERYVLNWAGKSDAFRLLHLPTTATLKPVPKESINFQTTENIFFEGENLEVLKVIQKSYFGKVQCIIIDPPYNTGNDSFIYPDSFKEKKDNYLKRVGDMDVEGKILKESFFRKNSKESGHYHSNWLSMMYPRLFLAKNLMSDEGVIFVHIDDNEVHNLRLMMNEIFGEENFIAEFIRRQNLAGKQDAQFISIEQDYILCYAKDFNKAKINKKLADVDHYHLSDEYEYERGKFYLRRMDDDGMNYSERLDFPFVLPKGKDILVYHDKKKNCERTKFDIDIILHPGGDPNDKTYNWRWSTEKIHWGIQNDVIVLKRNQKNDWQLNFKSYSKVNNQLQPIERANPYNSILMDFPNNIAHKGFKELFDNKKYFDYPKPVELIKHLISIGARQNDIILDFFAGSGTTAQAVLELNNEDGGNRKFILVQLPERCSEESEAYKNGYKTIAEISKERIRRVINKTASEEYNNHNPKSALQNPGSEKDLGFKVFQLAPSNFKIWRGSEITEENIAQQLEEFTNPVREGSEKENILYELMLKAGYLLTDKVELHTPTPSQVGNYYSVNNGGLIIALEVMNQNIIDNIIAAKPKKVITLDKLFTDNDQLKTNTVLQMRDAGIDFRTI